MPSDTKLSQYPASPRETLFRAIDNTLRADPAVRSLFTVFRSWRGGAEDRNDFAIGNAPAAIRLTPRPTDQDWWSTSDQLGWLHVDVELLIRGSCWDDLDRAWFVLERAIFPTVLAARQAVVNRFQAAQAPKGFPNFLYPALDPEPAADGVYRAVGAFRIQYTIPLNS